MSRLKDVDNCQCPICDSHFESYQSYGVTKREEAKCPQCGSLERYRLLYLYLKNETGLLESVPPKKKILEIGPRKCLSDVCTNSKGLDYFSLDKSSNAAMIHADIINSPFSENVFDAIVCFHVLEHISTDKKALLELRRLLKSDGTLFLQVPLDINKRVTFEDQQIPREQFEAVYGQSDHVRIYGTDFKERIQSIGLGVKVVNYTNRFTQDERKRYGLKDTYKLGSYTTSEDLYICTK